MRTVRALGTFAAGIITLTLAAPAASAADCSATDPGTLTPQNTRGLIDGRVQLEESNGSKQAILYEYKVSGCTVVPAGSTARVLGVDEDRHVTAELIPKSADSVTLQVNFNKNTLAPGAYELSVVSGQPGLTITQPINVDVKATGSEPWLIAILGALLGLLVLAARAAVASTTKFWTAMRSYFTDKTSVLPVLAGIAAAATMFATSYLGSKVWFGNGSDQFALLAKTSGALIAAGTTATAGVIVGKGSVTRALAKARGETKP